MPDTRKPIEVGMVARRALRVAEESSKRLTQLIHTARVRLERPAQVKAHVAPKAAPATRRPRRTVPRKTA